MLWTSYESTKEVRDKLDGFVEQLSKGDISCLKDLNLYFLPTSTFQEHSLQNNWTKEYMKLSDQFDRLYDKMKKPG